MLEFYSGATGPSGRFTEGFSLRRLHSAPSDDAPLDQDDRKVMKDLIEQLKIEQDN